MRAFLAFALPAPVRAALQAAQAGLSAGHAAGPAAPRLKLEPAENLHLTLLFLGDAEPDRLDRLGVRVAATCARHSPIALALGSPGGFGAPEPWVLWVGVTGMLDRLGALQAALEGDAVAEGWPRAPRPFMPHLTAARVRDAASAPTGLGARWAAQPVEPVAMTLSEVTLYESAARPGGMDYRPRRSWPLV